MTTKLPRRILGRTGFEISVIGIGTGSLGLTAAVTDEAAIDDLAVETLRSAIDSGVNYIDTSPGYANGHSDRRVGLALQEGWRERVLIATKIGTHPERLQDFSSDAVVRTIEESLEVLGTDFIDVVLVHDPHTMDPVIEEGGALTALENLRSMGTIGAIGLGVQNHHHLRLGIESDRFDVIQSPYDYGLMRTSSEPLITLATERNLGFITASPFQEGLLAGVNPDEIVKVKAATGQRSARPKDVARAHELWNWATTRGLNLGVLALQFCLREQRIASTLIGARTPTDVLENVTAAVEPIPDADWSALLEVLPTITPANSGGESAIGAYPELD